MACSVEREPTAPDLVAEKNLFALVQRRATQGLAVLSINTLSLPNS